MKQFKITNSLMVGLLLCLGSVGQADTQSSSYSCNFSYRNPNDRVVGRVGVLMTIQPSEDGSSLVQEKTIKNFQAQVQTEQGKITSISIQDLNTEIVASSRGSEVSILDPKTGLTASMTCGSSTLSDLPDSP